VTPGVAVRALAAAVLAALWLRPGGALAGSAGPGAPAVPEPAGAITGVLRNGTTGRPAPGQTVLLVVVGAAGPEEVGEVRTDAAGRFAFRGLARGRYLVQARRDGVVYAAHALVAGGEVRVTLTVYDAASDVPLRVALLGVAVEVHAGYVRVVEVLHLQNATARTFLGDVAVPLPQAARYVTYHAGFDRPRTERDEIRDRIVVRPGAHQLSFSYAVAGAGTVPLDRQLRLPVDRAVVFVTAPAEVRSPQFWPAPAVEGEDGRYTRAWARALAPGHLVLAVTGVPPLRRWPAPGAAAALAGLLVVGLAQALRRRS
jgi:5-hydroxyisourate hydrolase-like protein (transthyretin family)